MKVFLAVFAFIVSSYNFVAKQFNDDIPIPTIAPLETNIPFVTPTATPMKFTLPPKMTLSPSSIPTPQQNSNINDYVYPGSQTISSSDTSLSLKSSDSSDSIVSWYTEKVNGNYSSKSVAISNTNGNVSAMINASNNIKKINIIIQKSAEELYTHIEISIKS